MTVVEQLVLASFIVATTVLLHLAGLAGLLALLRRHKRARTRMSGIIGTALVVMGAAFGLFALHTIEIWMWAIVYHALGALGSWEPALYFSTTTYVTIGYGDIVLPRSFRLLGAIEGADGIILLGWSTAFFFGVVDRLKLLERAFERSTEADRDADQDHFRAQVPFARTNRSARSSKPGGRF